MSRPARYGKMGSSFDSEANSRGTSPPQSPRGSTMGSQVVVHGSAPVHQPMYYVQSPSRDSFTFNEDSQSYARSTPPGSPLASPMHKSLSSKAPHLPHLPHLPHAHHQPQMPNHQHQAEVNQFYLPGNPKPGSRRVLPQPANAGSAVPAARISPKKGFQPWQGGTIDEEEESYSGSNSRGGISRWCAVLLSIILALVGFVIVGVIYWLVCRPSAPSVKVKDVAFQNFLISEGNDASGVPTQVVSVNCTATLDFGNPSKYFGFHVSAPSVQLIYQQIIVAEGEMSKFYQKKQSNGAINLDVRAIRTPVYGAGPNLVSTMSSGDGVPMQLVVTVRSRAYVIWRIVRPKYSNHVTCNLVLSTDSKNGAPKLLRSQCGS